MQSGGGGTLPAYVQGNFAVPQTPQATVTVPYSVAQTAGDLNVVVVGWNDTNASVSSVKDSAGKCLSAGGGSNITKRRQRRPLIAVHLLRPEHPGSVGGCQHGDRDVHSGGRLRGHSSFGI